MYLILARRIVRMFDARLQTLSEGADVAGIQSYVFASLAKWGNRSAP